MTYPSLTFQQWRVLSLVNENVFLTASQLAHKLYSNQSAVPRCEELLDELWGLHLIYCRGQFENFRYMTTEEGDDYIENATKPSPPYHVS